MNKIQEKKKQVAVTEEQICFALSIVAFLRFRKGYTNAV